MPLHLVYFNASFESNLLDPNGLLERYSSMANWCEGLAQTGKINVSVIQCFSKDAHFRRNEVEYFFVNTRYPFFPFQWRLQNDVKKIFQTSFPDIVHTSGIPAFVSSLRTAIPETSAIVWQHHGGGFPTIYTRWIYRTGFRDVDAFFFTAEAQASEWQQHKLILSQPIVEVPESSTTLRSLPYQDCRSQLHLPATPVFLWVGHLNKNKDPLTVLAGFTLILQKFPSSKLFMAFGSTDLLSEVKQCILQRNLQGNVQLLGNLSREALQQWYSAADYFILGSHHEGSGYALIEAIACGATPIVTDIPSFRSLTGNGTIGALWTIEDPVSLARSVETLMQQPQLRSDIISYFVKHLSFEAIVSLGAAKYENISKNRLSRVHS